MGRASAITPDEFATFGELLRFLRRRAGLTQRELSIAVGYSDAHLSRLEKGERAPDRDAVRAQFVPALHLEHEPEWVERLLQLAAEAGQEVPGPAQATRPPAAPRHNLPLQLTSFIGREKEIAEVVQLLTSHPGLAATPPPLRGEGKGWGVRLLTLTGPGGCGKTRLALQVAPQVLNGFADGVWFVPLASLADATLVGQVVAGVFGLPDHLGRTAVEQLAIHLRDRSLLLLLDNCEHLVVACAELAEALLQACPALTILATSREPLGLAGETIFHVPSLTIPEALPPGVLAGLQQSEAARLFVDRAGAVQPGFALTPENAPAVAQVCRRLDGIPLAIELAAARVRALRVEQIAARLDDRFGLLTGGSRTALPRHQTLRAMIDWSHDLLSEAEQVLLRRLSVFAGGWTLEAAEAVCSDLDSSGVGAAALHPSREAFRLHPSLVLDLLTHLADKSLVVVHREQGQEARYDLLETIRAYALERLEERGDGEAEAVRRRHAEFFLALVEAAEVTTWRSEALRARQARLLAEQDNLRAALAWAFQNAPDAGLRLAGALHFFWFLADRVREGRDWAERALRLPRTVGPPAAWAKIHFAGGSFAWMQGDYALARSLLEEGVALFRASGALGQRYLGFALTILGRIVLVQGDLAGARSLLEESVRMYREVEESWGNAAQPLAFLGLEAALRSDDPAARSLFEESVAVAREEGADTGVMIGLGYLGWLAYRRGDFAAARSLYEQALTVGPGPHGLWNDTWPLEGLAAVAGAQGQPKRAARLFGAAEALLDAVGIQPDPADRIDFDRSVASVRAALSEEAFARAWAEGRAMTLEQAVTYALGTTGIELS